MIIINAGMPKSGTSLAVRYQRDLIHVMNPRNGIEEVRNRYNGFLDTIDDAMADSLRKIHDVFGPFAIKTHSEPSSGIRSLIDSGIARASFSFRDPRDTVLSALDHAKRTRNGLDPSGAFSELRTISDSISFSRGSINTYLAWRTYGKAFFIRYEDFMAEKMGVLRDMALYFELDISDGELITIYEKHESIKESAWNFNKGTTDRWRAELSQHDLALCDEAFGGELAEMGYERVSGNELKSKIGLRAVIDGIKQFLKN